MVNRDIVSKLITYIDKISSYCEGKDYQAFENNMLLSDACVFNLTQMGELVNRLDDEYIEKYPYIPWYQIRGLRNRIVHDYEGVNLKLVWDIIEIDLPELKETLIQLL